MKNPKRALAIKTAATRALPAVLMANVSECGSYDDAVVIMATISLADDLVSELERIYNIDWEEL